MESLIAAILVIDAGVLTVKTFLNGTLVSNIVLDTSEVATDTIDYVAIDSSGRTATSTRTVIIETAAAAASTVQ